MAACKASGCRDRSERPWKPPSPRPSLAACSIDGQGAANAVRGAVQLPEIEANRCRCSRRLGWHESCCPGQGVVPLETFAMTRSRLLLPILTGSLLLIAMPAFADAPKLDRGDTAWMLTSTALVLMMTVPGLALFYAGMVRKMNLLNTMAQSF